MLIEILCCIIDKDYGKTGSSIKTSQEYDKHLAVYRSHIDPRIYQGIFNFFLFNSTPKKICFYPTYFNTNAFVG